MAARGRKPKPTALKVLEGNPGKRPLNDHEPIPPKGELEVPVVASARGQKEWKRLASSLEAMGVLTMADLTAFAGYCQAYARWKEAEEFITQHGSIFQNALRLCAAGAAGVHCPAEPQDHAVFLFGFRPDTCYPRAHHRQLAEAATAMRRTIPWKSCSKGGLAG